MTGPQEDDQDACFWAHRKTVHPAVTSTSSSARVPIASPCAGAVTPTLTVWTAAMRKPVALEVRPWLSSKLHFVSHPFLWASPHRLSSQAHLC